MPSTPPQEIESRIGKLQNAMAENGLDGALVILRIDLFYFSGTGQDAHLFVPAEGEPLLMVRKNFERAVEESPLRNVSPIGRLSEVKERVLGAFPGKLKTLGMELDVLPVNNYRLYERLFPDTRIVDVSPSIRDVRMIKSSYEIDLIKEAARLNDAMYGHVKNVLEEGMTEIRFAGQLEAFLRHRGHQGFVRVRGFNQEAFYGHVMSGTNLAVPSCSVGPTGGPGANASFPQSAGHKTIQKREPVQVDYVGIFGGYMVDQARTFFLDDVPPRFLRAHETALSIQEALVDTGGPGVAAEALYNTAIEMARDAGLDRGFQGYPQPVPFVGHGVGLELDEPPVIGKRSPTILEEGMVMALEPKFVLPGEGLAGIENSYLVTSDGLERLTLFDDAIQVVG